MPEITHIAETALYVEDVNRAVTFYIGLFECEAHHRDERFCALRIADEQVLLLFQRGSSLRPTPMGGGFIPTHDGSGPLHVCFGMRAEDLEPWKEKLDRLNVAVESRVRWPGGATSLYFRDPDQNLVELATPGLWTQRRGG